MGPILLLPGLSIFILSGATGKQGEYSLIAPSDRWTPLGVTDDDKIECIGSREVIVALAFYYSYWCARTRYALLQYYI